MLAVVVLLVDSCWPSSRRTRPNATHINGGAAGAPELLPEACGFRPSHDSSPGTNPVTVLAGAATGAATLLGPVPKDVDDVDVITDASAEGTPTEEGPWLTVTVDAVTVGAGGSAVGAEVDDAEVPVGDPTLGALPAPLAPAGAEVAEP